METRMITVRTLLPIRLDLLWPGVKQIVRIERRGEPKRFFRNQVLYALTSLPPERFDAATLLALARDN